jgi:hypothetical protein
LDLVGHILSRIAEHMENLEPVPHIRQQRADVGHLPFNGNYKMEREQR